MKFVGVFLVCCLLLSGEAVKIREQSQISLRGSAKENTGVVNVAFTAVLHGTQMVANSVGAVALYIRIKQALNASVGLEAISLQL
jgi:hypothetical protein